MSSAVLSAGLIFLANAVSAGVSVAPGASESLQLGVGASLVKAKASGAGAGLALVSTDVGGDGYPDLISALTTDAGGELAWYRGNPEAWAPSTPASLALVKSGRFPSGFVADPVLIALPIRPDFAVAGDFDADGHGDVVVAQRGSSLIYLLTGSKAGLSTPRAITLVGGVDAMASGQIDRPDGQMDLAVAVSNSSGASLLTFTAGLDAAPRRTALRAAVSDLAIGDLDDSPAGDVVLLGGGQLSIWHGSLTNAAIENRVESLTFDFPISAMALGNFIWDRDGAIEIALLKDDGTVHFAGHGALDSRPFTQAEIRANRLAQINGEPSAAKAWKAGQFSNWRVLESTTPMLTRSPGAGGAFLQSARLSGGEADDLLVGDRLDQSITVLTREGEAHKRSELILDKTPIALLSLQDSAFVRPSLVLLQNGAAAPFVVPSVPLATFSVSKTADTNDGVCNADCSLREAIVAANAAAGADSITLPAGTYTLTMGNTGGVNEDASAQGDLDINDALTITGAGAATTIVQAGTTNANGIDKVFAFNPICSTAVSSSMSGVTVRFGRNTQPNSNGDFSETGGGIDVCNTGAGGFSAINVVVTDNSVENSYGGGINLDSAQPANGAYTITGSTISNNRTTSAASILKNGGGLNLFADANAVTLTNTTISGNSSANEGGGVYARHTNGGAITLSGVTISNNTAASRGGGVSNSNFGASSLTINNDSFVLNNVSQGTAAGSESRGGGVFVFSSTTTLIRETTITGNSANTGTFQGGGGISAISGTITTQFNRIAGNSAGTGGGSGLHNAGATINGTPNWWGCNAGPTAAPCDRLNNVSGSTSTTPHIVLRHNASPTNITVGQTSTLTADFLTDSAAGAIAVADLDALIGTGVVFNNAVLGTLSAAQTTIQANGTATATFTATGAGAGSADSVVDAQTQTANLTITAPSVSIAVAPVSVSEDGATNLVYTVTRSQSLASATVVNISTSGTATSGTDYTGGASTVTIAANATTAAITIDPTSDSAVEPDETVILTVAAGTGYTIGAPASATGTILNDDVPSASITVAPAAVQEDGAANLVYTVTLDQAALSPTTVNFTVGGTATSGTDYAAVTSPLVIATGNTNGSITVNPTADATIEADETVIITVVSGTGYTVGTPSSATGTILNDDLPNLSINNVSAAEGNAGASNFTFTVSLGAPAGPGGVSFDIATADGTATAGSDYGAQSLTGQTIAAGASTYSFTVLVNGDTLNEVNETFFVNVSNVVGANIVDGQGLGTIVNDDPQPSLSINNVSVTEGNAGTTSAQFTVSLSAPSGQSVSVNYATADGTAVAPGDYTSTAGVLTLTPGQTSSTVTVLVNGDTTPEANETFSVTLSAPVRATIAQGTGTGTILNDDSPSASISVSPASVLEDGVANLIYTIALSAPAITATTVNLSTAGTATSGSDYSGALSSVLIPIGGSNATLTIDPTADAVVEGDETVIISLLAGSDYTVGAPTSATGTITNDDLRGITVTESGGSTAVTEGGATDSFTVVLNSQPEANVQIALDGGTQVTAAPSPLSFTPANWNVPQTVTVTAIDDTLFENNPHPGSISFTVTSTDAGYNAFAVPAVAVSVTDNDAAPTISISSPSLPEGNTGTSVMNFVVSLSAASGLPVNFTRETADGTATVANSDYVALAAAAASIPAGQTSLTIPVTINGDTVFEGDETFSMNIGAVNGATPTTITGTGTILEDDQSPTTTTITSDLPDPSVVGQPYTVVVNVAASSSSPLGAVTISDGTGGTCGPVTLVAGVSPNSTASCDLTSTSIGAKTLTATYTPASTAFGAGSGTATHQVNASATTISVTGPATSQINTPTTFSFVLAVTAPGSGSPAGVVTLTGGSSSCQVTVPTATPSCSLSFGTLGPATVTAAFVPGDSNYLASSSSGAGNAQTTVSALSDLSISKDDGVTSALPGGTVSYVITASNAGPDQAPGTTVADTFPAACTSVSWTCVGTTGASCAANGSGNIAEVVSLPNGSSVTYTAACAIDSTATGLLVNTATVTAGANVDDLDLTNNSASDTDALTPQANLVAVLTAPTQTTTGVAINYAASARNDGPSNAEDVQIMMTFGSGAQFASVSPSAGGVCTTPAVGGPGDVICRWAGTTAVGETRSLTGVSSSSASGTFSITATVSSSTPDPVVGNNTASANIAVNNPAQLIAVPTTDRLGLALLALLLGLFGWAAMRRRI
ncbi:MAG: IPTL-CTERM sorting domain-containing protein [Dokdonella sp.]